jgi:hypothetical protein
MWLDHTHASQLEQNNALKTRGWWTQRPTLCPLQLWYDYNRIWMFHFNPALIRVFMMTLWRCKHL